MAFPWLLKTFVFFFGLSVGSFLNVCIYRLPRSLSLISPRSMCPQCRHPVAFYDGLLGSDMTIGESWAAVFAAHTVDKVLFVADPEQIPAMSPVLNARFAGQADVVQSHARFIEVVPKGVDKGTALAWLAQHFDIPQSEVLAAGDQGNDLAMVEWAGTGVAIGNAIPAVKEAATWIAPPVTEDGAVAILERFVLNEALA